MCTTEIMDMEESYGWFSKFYLAFLKNVNRAEKSMFEQIVGKTIKMAKRYKEFGELDAKIIFGESFYYQYISSAQIFLKIIENPDWSDEKEDIALDFLDGLMPSYWKAINKEGQESQLIIFKIDGGDVNEKLKVNKLIFDDIENFQEVSWLEYNDYLNKTFSLKD